MTTTTNNIASAARAVAGTAALLAASVLAVGLTALAYSITSEYGVSPNGNLPADLASGALSVAPLLLLVGGLVWLGLLGLAPTAPTSRRGLLAAGAVGVAAAAAVGGTVVGHLAR